MVREDEQPIGDIYSVSIQVLLFLCPFPSFYQSRRAVLRAMYFGLRCRVVSRQHDSPGGELLLGTDACLFGRAAVLVHQMCRSLYCFYLEA